MEWNALAALQRMATFKERCLYELWMQALRTEILNIKPEDLRAKFLAGVANLATESLQIGYPTIASAPHSVANGFKNLLFIAAATKVDFRGASTIIKFIKELSKFVSAAAASAPAAGAGAAGEK
ncbi:60S acidic ribosomal protein P0-like [Bactrocera dorsalis]|uniref:Large ribosomal subunit protein uL10 n=1 Tax=Bactrocera dorsalis TaxID=27457 RepID=A0ABM3JR51_BACDO|nr:60S acidic ribosomal protein P0-like [Bactrocera dorsalis]